MSDDDNINLARFSDPSVWRKQLSIAQAVAVRQKDELTALRAERDRYRTALEQYADRENWHRGIWWQGSLGSSGWDVADAALAPQQPTDTADGQPATT